MRVFDRLHREARTEERDKRSLSEFAWTATSPRFLAARSVEQLRAAAALEHHEGELGCVGRFARYELIRRGMK